MNKADLTFQNHGSITLATPGTNRGKAWLEDNCEIEDYQRHGSALAIEWRYAESIALGAIGDGLIVKGYHQSDVRH